MTQSPATPLPSPKERRRLRESGSLTQAQVAERVGVSRETVRSWETGRTTPRGHKREAYAKLLASLDCPTSRQEPSKHPAVTVSLKKSPRPTLVAVTATVGATATVTAAATPTAVLDEEPPATTPLTPTQAFDALYAFCAPALVRQAYLLTGRRELARESVERAFQLAWQRWPEVAVDRDPAGWVRATAYEYALSPWHRFRPRYRHPEPPPPDAADRALLTALLKLPTPHRRTLMLYDGVGLDLPETAAETEASTPATANRLLHAREAIAARLPELSDPTALHQRLAELASTERLRAARPPTVRIGSERRARFWTRAAIAFTVALIGTTALTVRSAPTHYEPPIAPGAEVQGVPPRVAPGSLSDEEVELREKLRDETTNGPERLLPLGR
ncbi:helix-turn-helix domain-containing protein [Streptomyces pseudovenezuelae]|uniref:DNA-directed RNA polymerase specialized sigma24 family protein n=1 Tax=Streptomyces pseudovenezuelae TaxID=67350 RepID=A0ABT6LMB5_9ACTN|nr:helix-turn-helix domain-containing protein [Streptomyces pseudovenezuelae]MDH6217441.1 DNA-directed RNA polymerase specialized sigma24 family protein [Streptomyces pseudovenezuelae]